MKKRIFFPFILLVCTVLCLSLAACGNKSSGSASNKEDVKDDVTENVTEAAVDTLESLIANDSDFKKSIEKSIEENEGLSIDVKGNDLIYYYDLTVISELDSELIKSEAMMAAFEEALAEQSTTFGSMCKSIEEETGITGVRILVNYTIGDEVVITGTFTSADAQ